MTQLLFDDFNNPALPGWTALSGTWTASAGTLTGNAGDAIEALFVGGDLSWTDYEVKSLVARIAPAGVGVAYDAAVVFRYKDPNNFYWAGLGCWGHFASISRVVNGVFQELVFSGVDTSIVDGQKYELKIVAKGTTLELWVNNTPTLTVTDGSHLTGGVGFRPFGAISTYDYIDVSVPTTPVDNTLFYVLVIGGATLVFAITANVLGVFGAKRKHKR